ncbi:MAG: MFS transporter [Candidatus Planktophila sp.]
MLKKIRAGFPIFFAAINMRAGLVLMAPLLPIISKYYSLSHFQMSSLLSLPIICFSASSLLMGFLGGRASSDRIITFALITLAVASFLRIVTGVFGLFLFTIFIGISIAVMNYEIPVWVKAHVSESSGLLTGIYVTLMGVGAAISIAISVPIAESTRYSWHLSLLPWAALASLAAVYWSRHRASIEASEFKKIIPFWRSSVIKSPVAWSLVFFFGLESMTFYASASWLPIILTTKDFSLRAAGGAIAFSGLLGSLVGLFFPHLIATVKDQRLILALVSIATGFSFFMMTVQSGPILLLWLCTSNIGISMAFPACLLLCNTKSKSPETTRSLSTMMQSIGYVISATGPFYASSIFELSGDWNTVLYAIVVLTIVQMFMGVIVGKNTTLD